MHKTVFFFFFTKLHVYQGVKAKTGLLRDHINEWREMSTCGLLFQSL
jgi:hypothetical protein